ncbi:RNA-binding protein 48 [Caerostris darwini]|uniref:RNA-binding protein 48 n=1 Tax=Caerostris darwini TaxID=1538125 RepID=A0AAV4WG22_9ARAC|nr:RNA-binding protein 48 [Caerostris darwini]
MESSSYSFKSISVFPHHVKQNICGSRAKYRDGRKDTAVKVYTINQESIYLLINNVPAIGTAEELRARCDQYGMVEDFRPLDDYPCEEFTEVYLVKYSSLSAARSAKKCLDDKSFFGCVLHICYAPEFETALETGLKLQDRRKYVAWKTNTGNNQPKQYINNHPVKKQKFNTSGVQPVTYIWAGKEYTEYPKPEEIPEERKPSTSGVFVPRQLQSKSSRTVNTISGNKIYFDQHSNLVSGNREQTFTSRVDESSYQNTISNVRQRVLKTSVPNVRVIYSYSSFDINEFLEAIPRVSKANIRCRFCRCTFSSHCFLLNHVTTCHPGKHPHKCPSCPKTFWEKFNLQSHLYTHDSARHFKCSVCGRTFRHSSSLARHKHSHRLTLQNH